ncbi:MAG: RIP metalloprotease RseP, partial [FCB group bacterium]|nr:RIP metalloprotease RseP [FCB group bacterium]
IFFHELGHFLVAKKSGIRVERFSLGFPPSIVKKKIGDTEYCIGLIPLGGYVKMTGENPDDETTGADYEYMSKSILTRASVIIAGPAANFFLAWFILWGLYFVQGETITDPNRSVIGIVAEESPAEAAGLLPGDIVISVNGTQVAGFGEMAKLISAEVEKPIILEWDRDGVIMSATTTTAADEIYNKEGQKVAVGKIGVGQHGEESPLGFFASAGRGFGRTMEYGRMIFTLVWDLMSLQVSPKAIGGPVFIAQMAGQTAQLGFSTLLFFMALLSVNLAILNVLPIPILDGGHLLFLLIEKLKGTPLSINQRAIAQQVGLVFLLLVIVLVTYNDIVRFITG